MSWSLGKIDKPLYDIYINKLREFYAVFPYLFKMAEKVGKRRAEIVDTATSSIVKPTNYVQLAESKIPELVYPEDIAPHLVDLDARIEKLTEYGLSRGIADNIRATINGLKTDLSNRLGATPRDVLNQIEVINEVRRNILKEFSNSNVAREVTGDIKQLASASSVEASVEALSTFQDALKQVLASKLDMIGQRTGQSGLGSEFLKTTKEYGAFKSLEGITDKFLMATSRGLVSEPRRMTGVNPNMAAGINVMNPLQATKEGLMNRFFPAKPELVNEEAARNFSSTLNRNTDMPDNIRRILSLSKSNYSEQKLPRNVTSLKANSMKLAVASQLMRQLGLLDPSTALADDGSELLNMPDKMVEEKLKQLSTVVPDLFEAPQGGYQSYFNGKLNHPMDKDAHMQSALDMDLPASERAKILGPLLEDSKYVPLDSSSPQVQP